MVGIHTNSCLLLQQKEMKVDIGSDAEPVIVFVPVPVAVLYVRVQHFPRPGEVLFKSLSNGQVLGDCETWGCYPV